jgi:hypothetical protein
VGDDAAADGGTGCRSPGDRAPSGAMIVIPHP